MFIENNIGKIILSTFIIFAVVNTMEVEEIRNLDMPDCTSKAFMNVVSKGYIELAKLLIQNGTDVNVKIDKGINKDMTALMIASIHNHEEIIELLLQNGADINAKDQEGNTALMHAVINGNKKIAKFLIHKGADVNIGNIGGWTILMMAKNNCKGIVEEIEEKCVIAIK